MAIPRPASQDQTKTTSAPRPHPGAAGTNALQRFYRRYEGNVIGTVAVLAFFLTWESVVRLKLVNPLFLSAPTRVFAALIELASTRLWGDLYISGMEFLIGFLIAVALGIPLGLWVGWNRKAFYAFNPFLTAFYSTPRVALLPLLIIWAGIGLWSKVLMVVMGAVFPIVYNTLAGVRSADPSLLRVARTFGASDMFLFKTVILPGSVPFVLSGLRLGVGRAILSMIVAEFYASVNGLGNFIARAGETFRTTDVFAGVIVVAVIGMVSTILLERLEKRFDRWRPAQH